MTTDSGGKQSESLNIYQRMHKVMQDVAYVQKEEKKNGMQYRFVSHDAVTAKLRPALIEHGILAIPTVESMNQDGNRTEVHMLVTFTNIDDPKDSTAIRSVGFGIDSQDKGPGKAVSYAFKYALLKAFCLETGDDPERDSIEHAPKVSPGVIKATDGAGDSLSTDQKLDMQDLAAWITKGLAEFGAEEAFARYDKDLEQDEKIYLWDLLDSKVRSAIKKIGAQKKLRDDLTLLHA